MMVPYWDSIWYQSEREREREGSGQQQVDRALAVMEPCKTSGATLKTSADGQIKGGQAGYLELQLRCAELDHTGQSLAVRKHASAAPWTIITAWVTFDGKTLAGPTTYSVWCLDPIT
jgi:hypothetical protein